MKHTNTRQGFTLIELLVVVLIIGILAAVAVPQYQIAVMKSRYATLKHLTRSIVDAQKVYYLANGQYATNFEQLDILPPGGKLDTSTPSKYNYPWGYCDMGQDSPSNFWIGCSNLEIKMRYQMYDHSTLCYLHTADPTTLPMQAKICQQETTHNHYEASTRGWTVWKYRY